MSAAKQMHQRAIVAVNVGHFRRSRQILQRALAAVEDNDVHARILGTLAYVEAELGDRRAALDLCDEALRLDHVTPHSRAVIRCQQAALIARSGDSKASMALYDLAIPALEPRTAERANALMNRGTAHLDQRHLTSADGDFALAIDDFLAVGDALGQASALHNRGYVALLAGNLVDALRFMEEAAPTLTNASAQLTAVSAQDRAEALVAAGLTNEATRQLEKALSQFGGLRLPRMHAECEFVLGRAILLSDPPRARLRARSAARRMRRHGNDTWALRADVLEAVATSLTGRQPPRWLTETDHLAAELRAHGLEHEAQLLDLYAARAAVTSGDVEACRVRLARAATTPQDSLTERLLERQVRADLAAAGGRRRTALRHLRAGLELLHDWQASFGSLDLMSSVVGHGRGLTTTGIQWALADGTPELVFEWSERARALTTRVVPVRPPSDPEAAADLVEIRSLTTTEPAPGTAQSRRLATLRERVRRRAWLGEGSGEVRTVAELDEVVDALGTDTALVSYLWDGSARLHALVATDQDRLVVDLGPSDPLVRLLAGLGADLDLSASKVGEAIARVVLAGRERRLHELSQILVAPLADVWGDRRVVITQAGILAGIPWSMLPGLVGRPVTVASAATRWLATRGLEPVATVGLVAGPNVARAIEEVHKSAACWSQSSVLVEDLATTPDVLELAARVDLLHVSAHGRHTAENPLFSGVLLDDGPLYGYDLDRIPRVPQIVILSACEVGRSTQRWGEESLGMVNAWLHAGARCVIASPAAVADDEACDVLQEVHRRMAVGAPPAQALAEATSDSPTSFICFGAGW